MMMRRILGVMVAVGALAAVGVAGSAQGANTNGLVGLWHFDEGSGTVAVDSSGLANDGTLVGGAGWTAQGRFGAALSLQGTASSVQVPGKPSLEPTAAVSVGAWVKRTGSPGTFRYVVAKGAAGCIAASYALYSGPSGGLFFYVSHAAGQYTLSPDAGTRAWDGNWHFVMGTYDGASVRLYVDGQQIGTGTPDTGAIAYSLPNSNDLFIGDYPGCTAHNYNGLIDDASVWSRALSSTEVASLVPPTTTTGGGGTTTPGGGSPIVGAGQTPGAPGSGQSGATTGATAPALAGLKVTPSSIKARLLRSHKVHPVISYTDSQAATSFLTISVSKTGVVKGGRCQLNVKKKPKGAKSCRLWVARAGFRHTDTAGANTVPFPSVRGGLSAGSYRLQATPIANALSGNTLTVSFKVN
jgi:Concanavalin A-like lectin/glucanases superfamily